ncbi:MAG TPA: hypothetical protein VM165_18895 [Planctomycetaceae bacterium]|nr:hypothetical protein [Planctomycetaceae bacterium]
MRLAATRTFTLAHLATWLVLWGLFTVLTLWATSQGLDDKRYVLPATLATVLGPMTGGISRGGQGCCLQASLGLLPYAAACALVGTAVQFVPAPKHLAAEVARLTLWSLGWFVWFASGIVSMGHALG